MKSRPIEYTFRKDAPRRLVDPDSTSKYLLELPSRRLQKLKTLALWYRENLGVKVTIAYLMREAIDNFILRETQNIARAKRGRLHAKVRNSKQ